MPKTSPPIRIISGNEEFTRRRHLDHFIQEETDKGRDVSWVDGKAKGELREELLTSDFFVSGERLIVVQNPQKANFKVLEAHLDADDGATVLLLHFVGKVNKTTKFGKLVKRLTKHHAEHNEPKTWDRQARAVFFCVEEAKLRGKDLPESLAQAMVNVCGTELGFLSREVQKVCLLGDLDGVSTLGVPQIKGALARIAQTEIDTITRALEAKDVVQLAKMLQRVRTSLKGDPTMQVCGWLDSALMEWLPVVNLDHQGIGPDEAADMLGKNKWYYKNKLCPRTRLWDQAGVIQLIQAVAEARRAVLDGHQVPWLELETGLLRACLVAVR